MSKIDKYIERVVAQAPPLTDSQRDRIVMLLAPEAGERTELLAHGVADVEL